MADVTVKPVCFGFFGGGVGFFVDLGVFSTTIKLRNIKGITNTITYPPFLCS